MKASRLLAELYTLYKDCGFELSVFPAATITAKYGSLSITHNIEKGFFTDYINTRIFFDQLLPPVEDSAIVIPHEYEADLNMQISFLGFNLVYGSKKPPSYSTSDAFEEITYKSFRENNRPCIILKNKTRHVNNSLLYLRIVGAFARCMLAAYNNCYLYTNMTDKQYNAKEYAMDKIEEIIDTIDGTDRQKQLIENVMYDFLETGTTDRKCLKCKSKIIAKYDDDDPHCIRISCECGYANSEFVEKGKE